MICQLHPPTFLATTTNSPSINPIVLTSYYMYQPRHHHTHGTSPPDCFETRVIMIPIDQTRCVDQMPSKTFVTTKSKLIANGRAVKCQKVEVCLTYLVFRNQASRKSTRENPSSLLGSLCSKS